MVKILRKKIWHLLCFISGGMVSFSRAKFGWNQFFNWGVIETEYRNWSRKSQGILDLYQRAG